MERKIAGFDKTHMVRATSWSRMYFTDLLKRANDAQFDTKKDQRLSKHECVSCFYVIGKLGGAAVTSQPCAACAEPQMYGSTCTDVLCMDCAKEFSLCKHCGGDFEMREKRRNWPTKKEGRIQYDADQQLIKELTL